MPPKTMSTWSCSTSFAALAAATTSSVASSRHSSSGRPSKPPSALMLSRTILATLPFATPTNESGPVWSAMTPTLMGSPARPDVVMLFSLGSMDVRGRGACRLRPELVPRVQVVEVLAAVDDPPIRHLEDDAGVEVELLAVARADVVLDADHAAVLVGEHALEVGSERPAGLPGAPPD